MGFLLLVFVFAQIYVCLKVSLTKVLVYQSYVSRHKVTLLILHFLFLGSFLLY